MFILIILSSLVYQHGDTLMFTAQDSIIDKWILGENVQQVDSVETMVIKRAKVSLNNKFFFVHEEKYESSVLLYSKIIFYDAYKNKIWQETSDGNRTISFNLSNIYDSLFIIVDFDYRGKEPALCVVKNRQKDVIIKRGRWERIVHYIISPNNRYLAFNIRNPRSGKKWDYIYFIDLELKKEWFYLLPVCFSCKKAKIELRVNDSGEVEVITKGEHRIFSREGELIDFFFDFE